MINSFQILGKSILQKAGYDKTDDENEKREIFLKNQAIIPFRRKNDDQDLKHAIAINFDTQKGEFEFRFDKEITPDNRDYFFAFSLGAPKDKRKFLSTNNMAGFYRKIFDDSLSYIEERRKKSKTKKWFSENISQDYDKLLKYLKDTFYLEDGKEYLLNKERYLSGKQAAMDKVEDKLKEKQKSADKPIRPEDLFTTLINKELFGSETKTEKNFPPVMLATIDGEHILDYKDKHYRSSYINLVYFDLFERFFVEKGKKDNICHVCAQKKEVIGDIPLLMKFYGTTNFLYFENLRNQDAYKSFAICRECLREVLTGMRYASAQLRDWLMGVTCYLIPAMESPEKDFEKKYKRIFSLLKANKGFQEDIQEIRDLVKKSAKKNFYFDLLFFDSPPGSQAFNVLKLISNVEYQDLADKIMCFQNMNQTYQLSLLNHSISLNTLRFNLFPSRYSHDKPDPKLYRKDVLDLLESFIHGYPLNYHHLIKRFMHIYRLKFHRNQTDFLAAFKMVLILTILNQIKPLKGVKPMEGNGDSMATDIQNKDYRDFIQSHAAVYQDHPHRQGLFLLGTVINKIIYAQRNKPLEKTGEGERRKLSATFMKKLNFSGMPARRINRLVGEVRHFANIYEVYEDPGIWGNITDRLQGMDESSMKPDEIVFYILSGISFADYIGMKKGMEKKAQEEEN